MEEHHENYINKNHEEYEGPSNINWKVDWDILPNILSIVLSTLLWSFQLIAA